jgi:hypothetical protein
MANSLAITLSIISFIGLIFLLFKRVPELVEPIFEEERKEEVGEKEKKVLKRKISLNNFFKKSLMKFKIFIQRAENKTSSTIKKLGEKHKKEEEEDDDDNGEDYWGKLKK